MCVHSCVFMCTVCVCVCMHSCVCMCDACMCVRALMCDACMCVRALMCVCVDAVITDLVFRTCGADLCCDTRELAPGRQAIVFVLYFPN